MRLQCGCFPASGLQKAACVGLSRWEVRSPLPGLTLPAAAGQPKEACCRPSHTQAPASDPTWALRRGGGAACASPGGQSGWAGPLAQPGGSDEREGGCASSRAPATCRHVLSPSQHCR